ncbi:hypothetical protein FA95DRAFT_1646065 [Auriscalpium vulgare]|uniref:Uncharacterized protein n=1 Tax=Auriscalpium vulgare TaxID=40419 RepID=A0ACB8R9V2_9AGAM|nr:hypothetical protein FA95DRAFT_1646065 [Auriscalpium vulgare]
MSLPNGIVCTPEEYALSIVTAENPYPQVRCLTRGQSIGLALTAESGFISLAAVLLLFGLVIRNVVRYSKLYPLGDWRLLQVPMDIYMLSLFSLDLIQALGTVVDVKWVRLGKVYSGSFCTAQGVIQQFGETGVAMTTTAITVHTFVTVIWRVGIHSRAVAAVVVALIWAFVALFVGISAGIHRSGDAVYDTPTPYWCWVGERYPGARIAGEYLWLWVALFSSVVVYVPLYFWSQGTLSVSATRWWRFHVHRPAHAQGADGARRRRALGMLAYPLSYAVLVLPLSIVRWISFRTGSAPSAATFVVIFLYGLSGASNVLLLLLTRPQLLLFTSRGEVAARRRRAPRAVSLPPPPSSARSRVATKAELVGGEDEEGAWNLPSSVLKSFSSSEAPHAQ